MNGNKKIIMVLMGLISLLAIVLIIAITRDWLESDTALIVMATASITALIMDFILLE